MLKQDLYRLANEIHTPGPDAAGTRCILDACTKNSYKNTIRAEIRRQKAASRKKRWLSAAACTAVLAAASIAFHDEVQAAITRIGYSISTALGLKSDLSKYKEILNTSVTSQGYTITLQEAAAAHEKLAVSFTLQREDGKKMPDYLDTKESLFINGEKIEDALTARLDFLDESQTIYGGELSFDTSGVDLSGENVYELTFTNEKLDGRWNFKFTADGTNFSEDTRRMPLSGSFTFPDGSILTLDELIINDLEQRITFHASKYLDDYNILLYAEDEQGRKTEFYVSSIDPYEPKGYMLSSDTAADGRIAADAKTAEVTVSYVQIPKTAGRIPDYYTRLEETEIWDLTKLR